MTSDEDTGAIEDRAPHDDSLQDVSAQMVDGAGDAPFQTVAGAQVRCLTCRELIAAATIPADDVARLEGASDPADMAMLVALTCPHCHAAGTLVVRYGPEASEEEADLLLGLERSPNETGRA